ncbi:MAG: CoA transferase [Deltaproteobacteria bacterium]|nr:CoA transferase [Deltaproteobacteria bacterium]
MAGRKTALEGIRVLDLGRYQAGPRAGLELARMGAEVIKLESLEGDESRQGVPQVRGQSGYWVQYNSGKKCIALDTRNEKGRRIIRDLVKISDVFIQNFRPGVIGKMGFSYDVLHQLNPGIIMLNVSAYGQYGPYKDRVGLDTVGQAISGFMSITGYPENPPTRAGSSIVDRVTALHGTIGVLAALHERQFSGEGQSIDVCLADSGYSLTEIAMVKYLEAGEFTEREGNFRAGSYNGAYQTKDGWVALVGSSQNIFERICEMIGRPEWKTDPRFTDRSTRRENAEVPRQALIEWFLTMTMKEAVAALAQAGIPGTEINNIAQAAAEPHLWERELMVKVSDPIAGTIHVPGKFIKLSRSETVVGSPAAIGQHNEEILCGLLNYSRQQLDELRSEGVIR